MLQNLRNIHIEDYNYPLPAEQIAQGPLEVRDQSKLLIFKDNQISEDTFSTIASHLPEDSLLISNETRVVHARLLFRKPSGSQIEIFCLELFFQLFLFGRNFLRRCIASKQVLNLIYCNRCCLRFYPTANGISQLV